uniref:Putative ovule protein n=1 Tax=Solanum chacoense TaxID=4108 RepID=A0A0V0HMF4_SOLCH
MNFNGSNIMSQQINTNHKCVNNKADPILHNKAITLLDKFNAKLSRHYRQGISTTSSREKSN